MTIVRLAEDLGINEEKVLYVIQPAGQRVMVVMEGNVSMSPPSHMTLTEVIEALRHEKDALAERGDVLPAEGQHEEQQDAGESASTG